MASDRRPAAMDVPPEQTAEAAATEPLDASAFPASSESGSASDHVEPPPPRDPNPVRAKRPRSGMAALGGGIVGGLLVAATGVGLWFAGLIPQREDTVSPVAARVAALELQLRDLSAAQPASAEGARRNEELAARLARLEGRAPAADPQLANRLAAAEAAAKSSSDSVAALSRRVEEATAAAAEARRRADAAATAAATVQPNAAAPSGVETNRSDIEALKTRLAAVETADKQQVDKSTVDSLAGRLDALQQTIAGIDQSAKALQAGQANDVARDRAVRLAIVASALNATVARGEPYAAELNAAKQFGIAGAVRIVRPATTRRLGARTY